MCIEEFRENTDAFSSFFTSKGIKKVAVYGYGKIGKSFIRLTKMIGIELVYLIDRQEQNDSEYAVYSPEDDFLLRADAIIITVPDGDEKIKSCLKSKVDCPIYGIRDIEQEVIATFNLLSGER